MLFAVHEPSCPWSYTGGICVRRLTCFGSVLAGATASKKSRMSGVSGRQPYRVCLTDGEPSWGGHVTKPPAVEPEPRRSILPWPQKPRR